MIDPRAIVDPAAELGEGVEVAPFAIVEAGVVVGARTRIGAHAYLCSGTVLGSDNRVHMNVVLGNEPQDTAYRGAPTRLVIGDRNVFREGSQVHRGTAEGSETRIGSDCFLMTNAHVAHNCRVADRVVLATGAVLGGHVSVGEGAFVSGNAVVHQHTRIGRLAMIQGGAAMSRDVPPFLMAVLPSNTVVGLNSVGLRRAGLDRARIAALRRAYRTLFGRRVNLALARERLLAAESERGGPTDEVRELLEFIAAARRGVCSGRRARGASGAADDDGE